MVAGHYRRPRFAFMAALWAWRRQAVVAAGEAALAHNAPLIMVAAAGGARMQEGILSLMQCPHHGDSAAIARARSALYCCTDRSGCVKFTACWVMFILLTGGAIGFAGPRVIQDTIKEKLPDFSAEYLLSMAW